MASSSLERPALTQGAHQPGSPMPWLGPLLQGSPEGAPTQSPSQALHRALLLEGSRLAFVLAGGCKEVAGATPLGGRNRSREGNAEAAPSDSGLFGKRPRGSA